MLSSVHPKISHVIRNFVLGLMLLDFRQPRIDVEYIIWQICFRFYFRFNPNTPKTIVDFILKGYARYYKPKTRLNQLRDILKVSYPNRIIAIRKKGINRMGDQMAFYSMNGFLDMAIFPDP